MTRESKNIIPPSPPDPPGGRSCQHSQKNKYRLFKQLERVMNFSQKLGPKDHWTLVNIWRVQRGKILTDNHVGLSIIGVLSDPV